jgi:hypothetical protein
MKDKTKKIIDVTIILIVFSLTGTTTAFLAGVIMDFLGVETWSVWFVLGYIFLIFPLYQGLLLLFGLIFGKFNFFYTKEKKFFKKIGSQFERIKNNSIFESES